MFYTGINQQINDFLFQLGRNEVSLYRLEPVTRANLNNIYSFLFHFFSQLYNALLFQLSKLCFIIAQVLTVNLQIVLAQSRCRLTRE